MALDSQNKERTSFSLGRTRCKGLRASGKRKEGKGIKQDKLNRKGGREMSRGEFNKPLLNVCPAKRRPGAGDTKESLTSGSLGDVHDG